MDLKTPRQPRFGRSPAGPFSLGAMAALVAMSLTQAAMASQAILAQGPPVPRGGDENGAGIVMYLVAAAMIAAAVGAGLLKSKRGHQD